MSFSNNNDFASNILDWIRQHKIISGVVGSFIFILLLAVLMALFGVSQYSSTGFSTSQDMAYRESVNVASSPSYDAQSDTNIPGVEIKNANLTVDSQDAAADEIIVRTTTESYNGYIEEGSQSESNTRRRIHLKTRVPSNSFDVYMQDLRDQLEVDDYQIRNYRIEVSEQKTELDIIADTAAMYESMKLEAQSMPLDSERIELTMNITERQLDLKERQNRLQSQVDRVTRQGDMATVNITLEERLSAEIWPEDIGNEFRDSLRDAFQSVVDIAIAIVTTSLVVFMTVLQWGIWILISLLILWFIYRFLRRLYNRMYK